MKKIYYNNHLIKKRWGQVFLTDKNIIDSIIKIINPQRNQKIIEIGPGLGALTSRLLNQVDSLTLIEQDINLVNYLTRTFYKNDFNIFNQDVLTVNFSNFINTFDQKLRLIGNLPYNISTKLIIHLLKYVNIIYDMHFMVQKEVANRLIAQPNTKEYGRLSIIMQYHCKITPLLEILPSSFIPIPKVKSTMICLSPYTLSPYPIINTQQLSLLTKLMFSKRRKIIKHNLAMLFNIKEITQQNIILTSRPENLTIHQYCILTKILNNKLKYLIHQNKYY